MKKKTRTRKPKQNIIDQNLYNLTMVTKIQSGFSTSTTHETIASVRARDEKEALSKMSELLLDKPVF